MEWITMVAGFVIGFAAWCLVYSIGYKYGVKDTEERWREAVGRADDTRRRIEALHAARR